MQPSPSSTSTQLLVQPSGQPPLPLALSSSSVPTANQIAAFSSHTPISNASSPQSLSHSPLSCPLCPTGQFPDEPSFVSHLSSCPLLSQVSQLWYCKHNRLHLFVSKEDKERHESGCGGELREAKAINENGSSLAYKGEGSAQPEERSPAGSARSRARNARDASITKGSINKLVSSPTPANPASEIIEFFGTLAGGFVKYTIRVLQNQRAERFDLAFNKQTIFKVSEMRNSDIGQWVKSEKLSPDQVIGEIFIGHTHPGFSEQIEIFKSHAVQGEKLCFLRDRNDHLYTLIGLNAVKCSHIVMKRDPTLTPKSILLVQCLRTGRNLKLREFTELERKYENEIAFKTSDISQIYQRKRQFEDERKVSDATLRAIKQNIDIAQSELIKINGRLAQESPESNQQMAVLKISKELEELKLKVRQKQERLAHELDASKEKITNEYVEALCKELEKLHDRKQRCTATIAACKSNIPKQESYHQVMQESIDQLKSSLALVKEEAEDLKRQLAQEKHSHSGNGYSSTHGGDRGSQTQKLGMVVHQQLTCRLCRANHVSMLTKPCNHCALCWSCYRGSVQAGLRDCLVCGLRIEFVFKIKFV